MHLYFIILIHPCGPIFCHTCGKPNRDIRLNCFLFPSIIRSFPGMRIPWIQDVKFERARIIL